MIRVALGCALLCACGGPQSGNPCDVGGKVTAHVQRLSGVAAFVCTGVVNAADAPLHVIGHGG